MHLWCLRRKKLDGDVRFADIVGGELYHFVNAFIFENYLENKAAVLSGASEKLPDISSAALAL